MSDVEDDVWAGTEFAKGAKPQKAPGPSSQSDGDVWSGTEFSSTPSQKETAPASVRGTSTSEPPKERTWAETGSEAWANIPKSAYEEARAIIQPLMAPKETLQAIGQLGTGLYSMAKGAVGIEQDPEQKAKDEAAADAVGDFYKRRYGSMAGFKEALAESPVGVLGDAPDWRWWACRSFAGRGWQSGSGHRWLGQGD